ncbi:capsule biosynthesis protein [Sphingomonas sp.]|uniref:capsule biosynthesis protein n=1 Tax=Sphingomonas sp. TaxID=28214 RepID=UPI003CC57F5E
MADASASRHRLRDPRARRFAYAVVALLLALLCVVPRPYVARAKLLPQDSSSAGLGQVVSSLGGQLQSFASLLSGGRPPNDLYLIIGRSSTVTNDVVRALDLAGEGRPYATQADARIALAAKVDIHLLLGGVVEIETRARDQDEALRLTAAYQSAISNRIGALSRETAARKAQIVQSRFREANARVSQSSAALDGFRRQYRLASPEQQLGSELTLRAGLQARLSAKQVELRSIDQFAGPENPLRNSLQAEIATLQAQLAQTDRPSIGSAGPNVSGLSSLTTRYFDLFRDYRFAQALYDVYARANEQTAVENLVAESASYIQVVEPANLDAERHYNVSAVAALALLVLAALFTELYVPATGLRWRDMFGREGVDDPA